jgi:hypothetical protein
MSSWLLHGDYTGSCGILEASTSCSDVLAVLSMCSALGQMVLCVARGSRFTCWLLTACRPVPEWQAGCQCVKLMRLVQCGGCPLPQSWVLCA